MFLFSVFLITLLGQQYALGSDLKLQYDRTAEGGMNEALPLGNGRIGALVYGQPDRERINFNDISLWSGNETEYGDYQSLGSLIIETPEHVDYRYYDRNLVLQDAEARVTYEATYDSNAGYRFDKHYFVSHPRNVLVGRWVSGGWGGKGVYNGRVFLNDMHHNTPVVTKNSIAVHGQLKNGMKYSWQVLLDIEGGTIDVEKYGLFFNNVDNITFYMTAATDYVSDHTKHFLSGEDPAPKVERLLAEAAEKTYDQLWQEHLHDYHSLFNRVEIDLGNSTVEQGKMMTNVRKVKASQVFDPDMEEQLFQYGRYLLISSSRDFLPANLQGIWNDNTNDPAWHSDYHTDINIEMNYWPAETTNLAECHTPLFTMIQSLIPGWRKKTQQDKSIVTPDGKHVTTGWTTNSHNLFGATDGLANDKTDSAWYAQHFYWHYEFGQNRTYLRDVAYPVIKELAQFWDQQLIRVNGEYLVPKGWSPEHGPNEDGVSYNQEIVWDLLSNFVKAADILGVDKELRNKMAGIRDKLHVPGVGSFGQLLEWYKEKAGEKTDHHRHTSHLFGVFPGHQINTETTPKLSAAALVSLDARGIAADSDVREWSFAWRTGIYARLHQGDKAHELIQHLLEDRNTCANLFGLHPPMQIDGNFGITASMTEMLVQSHAEVIEVLPALPKAWADGHVKGLRARGGYEVEIHWNGGKATDVSVKNVLGDKSVRVKYGSVTKTVQIDQGKSVKVDFG